MSQNPSKNAEIAKKRTIFIKSGQKGGKWAYFTPKSVENRTKFGNSPNTTTIRLSDREVVIDVFCNPKAPHFAGMLEDGWNGTPGEAEIIISPIPEGARGPKLVNAEEALRAEGRYERNDVDRP
jgi:hypothetical protein